MDIDHTGYISNQPIMFSYTHVCFLVLVLVPPSLTNLLSHNTIVNEAYENPQFEFGVTDHGQDPAQDPSALNSKAMPSFCALPEMLATWEVSEGCNGAPQFLSVFCKDHVYVTDGTLAVVVDGHPCDLPSHPSCDPKSHPYGGGSISGPVVFYGNISTTVKVGVGNAVSTTIVAYGGAGSFGISFNGGSLNSVGMSIGNGHYQAQLPFDAGSDYHRYDMIWGNGTASFYADDTLLTLKPPLQASDVPTSSLAMLVTSYACGASYCNGPFNCTKDCPVTTSIKDIAWTPTGLAAAKCVNPPSPPGFCDVGAALADFWAPKQECHKPPNNGSDMSPLAYFPNHVIVNAHTGALDLVGSTNITQGPGNTLWYCDDLHGITHAAGLVEGASLIHYGSLSVVLQAAATQGISTIIQLGDGNSTGIGLVFAPSGVKDASVSVSLVVNKVVAPISLSFDPTSSAHNYTFVWSPDKLVLLVDSKAMHTFAGPPQDVLPVSVAAVPSPTSKLPGTATLTSVQFTPETEEPAACEGAWPIAYKPFWEDHFNSTVLGEQWTAANNCTHGFPGQLYVKEGVVLEDGKLKLRAFEFKGGNKTGPDGVSQKFGSGWVDSASNRSNHWITDCNMNNSKAIPYNFLHGRWEISAKMPTTPNGTAGHFWTALWMLPDEDICWPKGGEVDILESDIWGQQPPYEPHAAYHFSHQEVPCFHDNADNGLGGVPKPQTPKIDYSQAFHTYSVELTPRMIIFSVDNQAYFKATSAKAEGVLPYTAMYLIMGNQLWKNWNYPLELPADFEIDYVKTFVPVSP